MQKWSSLGRGKKILPKNSLKLFLQVPLEFKRGLQLKTVLAPKDTDKVG